MLKQMLYDISPKKHKIPKIFRFKYMHLHRMIILIVRNSSNNSVRIKSKYSYGTSVLCILIH